MYKYSNISRLLVKADREQIDMESKRVVVTAKREHRGNVRGNEGCGMSGTVYDCLAGWLACWLALLMWHYHRYLYIQVLKKKTTVTYLPSPNHHARSRHMVVWQANIYLVFHLKFPL